MGLRILVTGRGSIAQRHVRHLREQAPGLQLAVLSGSGAADAAFEPCLVLADMAAGLQWRPDAVVIASVSSRHADELAQCLAAGLPCLAEKPLLLNRAEQARLTTAWQGGEAKAAVLVGCNLRYLPALRLLADELRQPGLGSVVRAQLEVGQDLRQWRPSRDLSQTYSARAGQGGGVVFDLVHEIDMARRLLGPLQMHAAVGGHLSQLPIAVDDVHVALLKRHNGAPVTISLDYVSRQPVRRYSIVAEGGTLDCDIMGCQLLFKGPEGTRVISSNPADFDVAQTYAAQMSDWLAAIRDPGHVVASGLADGLASAALMLDMKEALS